MFTNNKVSPDLLQNTVGTRVFISCYIIVTVLMLVILGNVLQTLFECDTTPLLWYTVLLKLIFYLGIFQCSELKF